MSERDELPPRLGDLLGTAGARAGIADPRATGILWTRWPEIVGAAVAANAEPTSLRAGVLRVRATTPTWANELTYLAGEIRRRANQLVGAEVVREVRVWTGPGAVAHATRGAGRQRVDGGREDVEAGQAEGALEDGPEGLLAAFERARAVWLRRRSRRA
ncbi:MAG TPA: DUF721 domain-containing protein [Actinomycetota bacterium]|nr:DUF721 domain-containing protein [Actinomycetota bacterium]